MLTGILPVEVMPRAGLHVDAPLLGSIAVLTLISMQMAGFAPALLASKTVDESVLRRRIGDDSVMYDQLQRLAHEADRPNLTLRILPLDAQHTVFGESFTIFGFGFGVGPVEDSDAMLQDVVSTEQLRSGFTLEGERETYLHRIAFQMLAEASLDPTASAELVLQTAQAQWSGGQRRGLSVG